MALSQLYHYYLSIIYTYYYYKLQLYVKKIYVTVEQINEKVKWSEVSVSLTSNMWLGIRYIEQTPVSDTVHIKVSHL